MLQRLQSRLLVRLQKIGAAGDVFISKRLLQHCFVRQKKFIRHLQTAAIAKPCMTLGFITGETVPTSIFSTWLTT